jgi:hypothetical protein
MKLIVVDRSKPDVYERLKRQFADDVNIEVVWDRRRYQRRRQSQNRGPERRSQRDRRKFEKPFNGKDYIIIHMRG